MLYHEKIIMIKGFSVSIFIMTLLPFEIRNYTDMYIIFNEFCVIIMDNRKKINNLFSSTK